MPRVTERLRDPESFTAYESVFLCISGGEGGEKNKINKKIKLFGASSACAAFSLKGNVIQAAERSRASRGHILYGGDERGAHS